MNQVYVGVDLGSSAFQQVAMKTDGSVRVNRDFRTSEANLIKAFSDLKGELHVHLEAGELTPWAASIIRPLVNRVVCSHPQSNAWIAKMPTRVSDRCLQIGGVAAAESLQGSALPQEAQGAEFKTLVQHYDELTASRRG